MTEQDLNVTADATDNNRPSPILVIFLVIPLLGILGALLMIATSGNNESTTAANPNSSTNGTLINRPAPEINAFDLDGQLITLESYAGRPIFLNFWQTTCEPCVREMPALAEFHSDQGEDGAVVLAVNVQESSVQVNEFLEELGLEKPMPIVLDPDGDVRRTYAISGLPTTYVIAPDGNVRFVRFGELGLNDLEEYITLLQDA